MVKVGPAQIEALPAKELEARGVARNGKGEGVFFLGVGGQPMVPGGVDGDLVGQGTQGSQQPGTAHHDSSVGLLHHG